MTADYRAVTETRDFHFVVGRRGTGKSALFLQASKHFAKDPTCLLSLETPTEHVSLDFNSALSRLPSYVLMRAAARLCWRGHILLWLVEKLLSPDERFHLRDTKGPLDQYKSFHRSLFECDPHSRFVTILRECGQVSAFDTAQLPASIATALRLEDLQRIVGQALVEAGLNAVLLFDGLDEGWEPTPQAAANLAGLANSLVGLRDAHLDVRGTAFVRDSMFRNLATIDTDFSRLIEAGSLRLAWDEDSLLHLVTNRLRITLGLEAVEQHVRVWNKFVSAELQGRDGFSSCLKRTLQKPRDIVLLLNKAALIAQRAGRPSISMSDVERAGDEISVFRLNDLLREYEPILPGLRLITESLAGQPALMRMASAKALFDEFLERDSSRDGLVVVGETGSALLLTLFAIGIIGVRDGHEFRFTYDGSDANVDRLGGETEIMVHPCYWPAIGVIQPGLEPQILAGVVDDDERRGIAVAKDLRFGRIGSLLQELEPIPVGREGAEAFEGWTRRIFEVLFSGDLRDLELRPNGAAVRRRDLVGTIKAESGFWSRVNRDYNTRQLVVEIKNYEDPTPEDFVQILGYSGKEYGNFALLVTRSDKEASSSACKQQLKSLYHDHGLVAIVVPSVLLKRGVEKYRNNDRHDYAADQLEKKLSQHVRATVSIRSANGRPSGEKG